MSETTALRSWREVLKIHPAAEMFPLMSPEELRELADDIKKNGLLEPVETYYDHESDTDWLIDGRNRFDAAALLGWDVVVPVDDDSGEFVVNEQYAHDPWGADGSSPTDAELVAHIVAKNLRRRHLTKEQKRDVIAKLLKLDATKSDRTIGKTVKVDHKTVGTVRSKLESTGEIPQLTKTTGADGKSRPAKKKTAATPSSVKVTPTRTVSARYVDPTPDWQADNKAIRVEIIDRYRRHDEATQRQAARQLREFIEVCYISKSQHPKPAKLSSAPNLPFCSFCGKSQHEVRTVLIAGPGCFICDECLDLCNEIRRQHETAATAPTADPTDDDSKRETLQ